MSEYVSKEELKKFFEGIEITVAGRKRAEAIREVFQAIYNGVMKLPATDAEPVRHGKWIYIYKKVPVFNYQCSECGARSILFENFCPYCGADMRETE